MLLVQAIAAVRASMDDMGLFLTATTQSDAASQNTLHVADTSQCQPGTYVTVGMGPNVEGHLVVGASTTSGAGALTLATPLVNQSGANNPVGLALVSDEDYTDALTKAIAEYSRYRPLKVRYPSGGLAIVAGTDTYTLPTNWIAPERDSFDAAVGIRSAVDGTGGVYTYLYEWSDQFSAVGFGSTSNFGPNSWYNFAPIAGNPADNPNSGLTSPSQPVTFTFIKAATPQLVIKPVPAASVTYDFFYLAQHTVPGNAAGSDTTVPGDDLYLVTAYAKHLRCNALATSAAKSARVKVGDREMDLSKSPAAYAQMAKDALAIFEKALRFLPHGFAS